MHMRSIIVVGLSLTAAFATEAQHPLRHWTEATELRFATSQPVVSYSLRADSADLSGWNVEMRIGNAPARFRLAMAKHPEYDERYWRFLQGMTATSAGGTATITRADSALWDVAAPAGEIVTIRYRVRLAAPETPVRGSWRPFLSSTGGLTGGTDFFLYVLGAELAPAHVKLMMPAGWSVATALTPTADPSTFAASSVKTLVESPIFVGRFHDWRYEVDGVPHRVVYWSLPDGKSFDSVRFVGALERLSREAIAMFGRAPYRDYTFIFQDGAYGGLEHPSSVTLGAPSEALARDPLAFLREAAHEYLHLWNLMRIRPAGYGDVDYRAPAQSPGLWFSEGLTIYFADALLRRAGLKTEGDTREARLASLIEYYLGNPGAQRFSAEAVSRVAYNAGPDALGDYSVSTHMQGELIGTLLDFRIRDATNGTKSMDDVMRMMLERHSGEHGFMGRDVERAIATVCGCSVTTFFDAHVRGGGSRIDIGAYLKRAGLSLAVTTEQARNAAGPIPDLRVAGFTREGEQGLTLRVLTPTTTWARAGLHTGDRIVSMNGTPLRTWPEMRSLVRALKVGDTVNVVVDRPGGRFATRVDITAHDVPRARISALSGATPRQQAVRERWLRGW
jgi:predicted metalloprotease with PDZ domain